MCNKSFVCILGVTSDICILSKTQNRDQKLVLGSLSYDYMWYNFVFACFVSLNILTELNWNVNSLNIEIIESCYDCKKVQ